MNSKRRSRRSSARGSRAGTRSNRTRPRKAFEASRSSRSRTCVGCKACAEVCPAMGDNGDRRRRRRPARPPPGPARRQVHFLRPVRTQLHTQRAGSSSRRRSTTCPRWTGSSLTEEIEHELVLCEVCGAIVGTRKHLRWVAEKLGAKAYANPTLIVAADGRHEAGRTRRRSVRRARAGPKRPDADHVSRLSQDDGPFGKSGESVIPCHGVPVETAGSPAARRRAAVLAGKIADLVTPSTVIVCIGNELVADDGRRRRGGAHAGR